MLLPTHNPFFFKIINKADSKFDKRFYILIGKNNWLSVFCHNFVVTSFFFTVIVAFLSSVVFINYFSTFFVIREHILVFRSYELMCMTVYIIYIHHFYVHDNFFHTRPHSFLQKL